MVQFFSICTFFLNQIYLLDLEPSQADLWAFNERRYRNFNKFLWNTIQLDFNHDHPSGFIAEEYAIILVEINGASFCRRIYAPVAMVS